MENIEIQIQERDKKISELEEENKKLNSMLIESYRQVAELKTVKVAVDHIEIP